MATTHTITLCKDSLVEWMTANGASDVAEEEIESEIKRYQQELGKLTGFDVEVSTRVLETKIDGHSLHYDDNEEFVRDCEAVLSERFW